MKTNKSAAEFLAYTEVLNNLAYYVNGQVEDCYQQSSNYDGKAKAEEDENDPLNPYYSDGYYRKEEQRYKLKAQAFEELLNKLME